MRLLFTRISFAIVSVVLLLSHSCTIEKRHFNKGYSISWKHQRNVNAYNKESEFLSGGELDNEIAEEELILIQPLIKQNSSLADTNEYNEFENYKDTLCETVTNYQLKNLMKDIRELNRINRESNPVTTLKRANTSFKPYISEDSIYTILKILIGVFFLGIIIYALFFVYGGISINLTLQVFLWILLGILITTLLLVMLFR